MRSQQPPPPPALLPPVQHPASEVRGPFVVCCRGVNSISPRISSAYLAVVPLGNTRIIAKLRSISSSAKSLTLLLPLHPMLTTIDENLGFDFMREQVVFAPIPTVIGYIRAGKLCALAVTSATRLEVLLNVPTVAEFMPGYEASTWSGIGAPKSTSSTMRSTQASPILNLWRSSQT